MGKFSDSPYYVLEDFLGNQISYGHEYPLTAHLMGPKSGIIAKNSFGFDLYLKTDTRYYRINVQNILGSPVNDMFTFIVPVGNYMESELSIDELGNYIGYELYFRKEGLFYDYVNNYVPADHDEQFSPNINTNKHYAYFGKLYTTGDNTIVVSYEGYKIYVNNIVPENNRNELLTEFINVCFDRAYSTQYNLFKNLLTLSDPKEVDENYLYYIAEMYRMTIPESLSDIKKREYVAALPELMKRKGTYSSLYIIWKLICSDTSNYLNVYERWNDWPFFGSPLTNFSDVIYTFNPLYGKPLPTGGAGSEYYYSGQNVMYTTTVAFEATSWTIAHNLSNQYPFIQVINSSDEVVVPSNVKYTSSNKLSVEFDGDLVAGRMLTFNPTDTTADNFYLYTTPYPSNSWSITHGLGTLNPGIEAAAFPLVQVIDSNNEMIVPDDIEFVDGDNVVITFNDTVQGKAIIGITPDTHLHTQAVSASTWNITHNHNTENVIVQVIDSDNKIVDPGLISIVDENNITITFSELPDEVSGYASIFSSEGSVPYPIYEQNNKMLSPHYLIEIDLSNEPFGDDYIINEALITELFDRWEEIRPVCKFSHYQQVISPISNFSGRDIQLYDNTVKKGHLYTKCCQPVRGVADPTKVSIYRTYTNREVWEINHGLDSENVIVQCFDLNQNMMVPKNMYPEGSDTTIVEWNTATAGFAYISKEDYSGSFSSSAIWTLNHNLGLATYDGLAIQQATRNDKRMFFPVSVKVDDENQMTFTLSDIGDGNAMVTTGSYETSASEPLLEWTISHALETEAIQAQFYDEDYNVVYPKNVQIIDLNTIKAIFSDYITPGVVIKKVGLQTVEILDRWAKISYVRVGSGTSASWDAVIKNSLETDYGEIYGIEKTDSDQYFVKSIINTPEAMSITELGIFDNDNNISFYTSCSEIYKPANMELILWFRINKTIV